MNDSLSWNYVNKERIYKWYDTHVWNFKPENKNIHNKHSKNGDENNNNIYIKNGEKKEFKWAASNSCNGEKKIEAIGQITYQANIVQWTVNWQVRRKSHKPNTNGDITITKSERGTKKQTQEARSQEKSQTCCRRRRRPYRQLYWCTPRIWSMLTA